MDNIVTEKGTPVTLTVSKCFTRLLNYLLPTNNSRNTSNTNITTLGEEAHCVWPGRVLPLCAGSSARHGAHGSQAPQRQEASNRGGEGGGVGGREPRAERSRDRAARPVCPRGVCRERRCARAGEALGGCDEGFRSSALEAPIRGLVESAMAFLSWRWLADQWLREWMLKVQ